jgi:hypothetical protein
MGVGGGGVIEGWLGGPLNLIADLQSPQAKPASLPA